MYEITYFIEAEDDLANLPDEILSEVMDYIEKYKSLGYEICTLDSSSVQKKNKLFHFDGQITLEKLKALKNENICFVTHTQEKKNLIKCQLQTIGVLK